MLSTVPVSPWFFVLEMRGFASRTVASKSGRVTCPAHSNSCKGHSSRSPLFFARFLSDTKGPKENWRVERMNSDVTFCLRSVHLQSRGTERRERPDLASTGNNRTIELDVLCPGSLSLSLSLLFLLLLFKCRIL